ncbi:uncharacterized protein BX664DRAFT_388367 [Halteromyces radiatus]|uniref:uncharacterized protein n=1 Tax=Halteromyces radiatus TaxID=101107 RepID=UPI00221E6B7E|nr:uncharacterized protein BX664DRAFT_388367 [Halteromyces radiatus]KAI8081373.1 hypothetical protein BX664DRAFT_388367 [Halteromyces radiatus]
MSVVSVQQQPHSISQHGMKEISPGLEHTYYPPSQLMMGTDKQTNSIDKPRMELVLTHNQLMEIPSQQNNNEPCTVCKDMDGNILFYRPSMALHTLFQVHDDSPSRYSNQRLVTNKTYLDTDHQNNHDNDDDTIHNNNNNNNNNDINGKENQIIQTSDEDGIDDDETQQRLVIPKHRQLYVTLYDNHHLPLWSLIEQDWHTMTLLSRQTPQKYMLMTTSTFSFSWDQRPYQWRMQMADDGTSMDLLCEKCHYDQSKVPIALLTKQATRLLFFENNETTMHAIPKDVTDHGASSSNNPFRSLLSDKHRVDDLDSFLILSSLLLNDLIHSQLRALGGGKDAMMMMMERQQQALKEEETIQLTQSRYHQGSVVNLRDDDDIVVSTHDNNPRWSSTGSMKSLELDPGIWRCWWGYGCWWTFFPCFMPGGWFDRRVRRHHHRSRVTRRMQGWQQQE